MAYSYVISETTAQERLPGNQWEAFANSGRR